MHNVRKGEKKGHLDESYCSSHPVVCQFAGGVLGNAELCIVSVFVKNTLKEMEALQSSKPNFCKHQVREAPCDEKHIPYFQMS